MVWHEKGIVITHHKPLSHFSISQSRNKFRVKSIVECLFIEHAIVFFVIKFEVTVALCVALVSLTQKFHVWSEILNHDRDSAPNTMDRPVDPDLWWLSALVRFSLCTWYWKFIEKVNQMLTFMHFTILGNFATESDIQHTSYGTHEYWHSRNCKKIIYFI